ncbi:unnamed protein product [Ascophyllum nodosum]
MDETSVPEIPRGGAASSWRFWDALSGSFEDARAGILQRTMPTRRSSSVEAANVPRRLRRSISLDAAFGGEAEQMERLSLTKETEEEKGRGVRELRARARAGDECTSGNQGGGDRLHVRSGSGSFQRFPLQRGTSMRRIPEDQDNVERDGQRTDRGVESDEEDGAVATPDGDRSGGEDVGGTAKAFWGKAKGGGRTKGHTDCNCMWCRTSSFTRYSHHANQSGKMGGRKKTAPWAKKRPSFKPHNSAAVEKWEHLVSRWIALQLARSGDTSGMREFLENTPHFSDKENLLRAAVRYKQYSLVKYFLDEQHMDVNLVNSGIPLVWYSVLNAQKEDSGVMLRYLLQRGADIKAKSNLGQNVLFLVAYSRGKEAIPTLKYLVETYGLSLTEQDNFGSEPIHWAVLHGHLDTVQWISLYTRYRSTRADWAGVFQKIENIGLVRPEHMGAMRSWRIRGLQKSASSLTPLGVAVLHNHEDIARWLMGLRSEDPACIVRKRDNLFREENRDLALVAKIWPELLPEVLQGFEVEDNRPKSSWDTDDKRAMTPTGWSEKIYDLKLLYGHPEVPANRSPLMIFLGAGYPPLFDVKVVQMVVALKWSLFGQRCYLWELLRFSALSLTFILGFIIWGDSSNWDGHVEPGDHPLPVIGGSICRVVSWVITLYNLLVEEGRELKASKSIRKYLLEDWNLQSVVAYMLVLVLVAVFRPWSYHVDWGSIENGPTYIDIIRRLLTAPAALILFTRCMEHLAVWKSTGIFIAVMRMVFVDTASWAIIFVMLEMGFALAFLALLKGSDGYNTLFQSMVEVFRMSMGDISLPFSDDATLDVVATLMFVCFMLTVTVVYLNLLVALMTSGYTKVKNRAAAQATMNRASALVKWEGIISDRERRKAFDNVAPGRGKQVHISLNSSFVGGVTELFCTEEGAIAVEPEQSSIGKTDDSSANITKELEDIRKVLLKLLKRELPRVPQEDAEGGKFNLSDVKQAASFRRRQAGMLDANGHSLSRLRITGSNERQVTMGPVTSMEMQDWWRRAREVEREANSTRGLVRAQALVRGYISRSKHAARFSSDNNSISASRGNHL